MIHWVALLALWLGCARQAPPVQVERTATGLVLRSARPIAQAQLSDPQGRRLLRVSPPAPVMDLELRVRLERPGEYTLRVRTEDASQTLPVVVDGPPAPFALTVEAPVGQGRTALEDGGAVDLVLVDGAPTQVAVVLTAHQDGAARLEVGARARSRSMMREGERLVVLADVTEDTDIIAVFGEEEARGRVHTRVVPASALRERVRIEDVVFPADSGGSPDLARVPDRVTLPARWWQGVLDATGLGFRPRDVTAPWSWVGVSLGNQGEDPLNVVIRSRVLDHKGQPAPAFAPRMREDGAQADGAVTVLLRVPPGQRALAALPFYVDPKLIDSDAAASQSWVDVIEVIPVGGAAPLLTARRPVHVSRGSSWVSLGFGLALLGTLLGSGLVLLRGRRWLRELPTSAIMTIAMFGALTFMVSAASRLFGLGVAAVLGPFATLLTGLVDDALRYTLLATLVSLLPRPGVVALAVLTNWLLTGMALGELLPTDILFVANRLLWLEALLWVVGITRATGWLDQPAWARWLRLSVALGGASVITGALAFCLHMVLYRLFFADWYVALLLAGPGFAYVLLACAIAVPFARSLRRIQR